ncbi:hypothetical protein RCL1_006480 [Eukaryota sp. TZLM3-RCL]
MTTDPLLDPDIRTLQRAFLKLKRLNEIYEQKNNQLIANSHGLKQQFTQETLALNDKIRKLTDELQSSYDSNSQLKIDVSTLRNSLKASSERISSLESTLSNLRSGFVYALNSNDPNKPRSREEKIWKELSTSEVLSLSRPNRSFPIQNSKQLNSVEHIKVENRRLNDRIKQLTKLLEEKESTLDNLRSSLLGCRKSFTTDKNRLELQLTGAVRRVQWLVTKLQEVKKDCAQKDVYITRLEAALVSSCQKLSQTEASSVSPVSVKSVVSGQTISKHDIEAILNQSFDFDCDLPDQDDELSSNEALSPYHPSPVQSNSSSNIVTSCHHDASSLSENLTENLLHTDLPGSPPLPRSPEVFTPLNDDLDSSDCFTEQEVLQYLSRFESSSRSILE